MRWLFAAFLLLLIPPPAHAAEPVDTVLALVDDVSRSIDDSEFDLQKSGYYAAFTDRDVISAIKAGPLGAIAVIYIEFASTFEVRTVLDWTVIRDEASAAAFANAMRAAPRSAWGRTAIGSGIDHALEALTASPFDAQRRVIDVCGDGTNNNGPDVSRVRDKAIEAGVTINGLAIVNDHPVSWTYAHVQPPGGLPNYYRENVTGGPGSFVLEVHDFQSFGQAIKRKLISEIARRAKPAGPLLAAAR
jgi:hypothetical protein